MCIQKQKKEKSHKDHVTDNITYTATTHCTMFNWGSQRGDVVNPESWEDDKTGNDNGDAKKNENPFNFNSVEFPSFHNDSTKSGLQDVDSINDEIQNVTDENDIVNNDVDQHDGDVINDITKIQHNKTVMFPSFISKAEKEKEAKRRVSWKAEESDLPEAKRRISWQFGESVLPRPEFDRLLSVASLGNTLKESNQNIETEKGQAPSTIAGQDETLFAKHNTNVEFLLAAFVIPCVLVVWYAAAILFPPEASKNSLAKYFLWTDGALTYNDEGHPILCPRSSICSEGVFQIIMIALARIIAFASYVFMTFTFVSKMHFFTRWLSSTYMRKYIPFENLHFVHTFIAKLYGVDFYTCPYTLYQVHCKKGCGAVGIFRPCVRIDWYIVYDCNDSRDDFTCEKVQVLEL